MAYFKPRKYQEDGLATLGEYLEKAAAIGPDLAFYAVAKEKYRQAPGLPELPYVCLRIPTGGGKTLMAAHAVGLAIREYLQRDQAACLWLVPTTAILDQTLKRLRDPEDPYRRALEEAFEARVHVLSVEEALKVKRATLDSGTCVIVSTLAALRVEDTDGRRVYDQNGSLMEHFTGLDPSLLDGLDRHSDGAPVESLANVLRLRHPVVIVDEAHNARTKLSLDTLARFSPACILEFTATPNLIHRPDLGLFASNVLVQVSAAQLRDEEMIKLPVRLITSSGWTEAVGGALAKRAALEVTARAELTATGEYVRPIVLYQAQPKGTAEAVTAEALREALINDFNVPAAEIAIATGTSRELDGIDLSSPECAIRHVITVQALREGWDCPFAYVLCSVAELSSARAVEQLLGRVLRMPKARRKKEDDLNCAYAYVVSTHFAEAAKALKDALVDNGFQRIEADAFVGPDDQGQQQTLFTGGLFAQTTEPVPEAPTPAFDALPAAIREQVEYDPSEGTLTVHGELSADAKTLVQGCFTSPAAKAAVERLYQAARGNRTAGATAPAAASVPRMISLPRLYVRRGATLELFSDTHLLRPEWRIAGSDPTLSEAEFSLDAAGRETGDLDVDEHGKVRILTPGPHQSSVSRQLSLLEREPGWTPATLAVWIDRRIPHPDLDQADAVRFIHAVLQDLIARRGATIDQVARHKFRLVKAIATKIDSYRAAERQAVYRDTLFGDGAGDLAVLEGAPLVLTPESPYAPAWYYEGSVVFNKALHRPVGELKSDGEEFLCACAIDHHPNVRFWDRNLEGRPKSSFWLQTSTDRFYPDFVGQLEDGRAFAVEYKGEHLWSGEDATEKRELGELWAALSAGSAVFVMPKGKDWGTLTAALNRQP